MTNCSILCRFVYDDLLRLGMIQQIQTTAVSFDTGSYRVGSVSDEQTRPMTKTHGNTANIQASVPYTEEVWTLFLAHTGKTNKECLAILRTILSSSAFL